jgi:hypothetical protein
MVDGGGGDMEVALMIVMDWWWCLLLFGFTRCIVSSVFCHLFFIFFNLGLEGCDGGWV